MYGSAVSSPEVRRLLRAQDFVISRAQALGLQVSGRAIRELHRAGIWRTLIPGVYVATPQDLTLRQRCWAAHLACGERSAIGGQAALTLIGASAVDPATIQVWTPVGAQRLSRPELEVSRDGQARLEHRRGQLPVIRCEDAVLDLGAQLGFEAFVRAATDALRERRTSVRTLQRVARGRGKLAHRRAIEATLADLAGVESTLEWEYLRRVERAHGLPRAVRQRSLSAGTVSDAVYGEYGVVVELDGRVGHADRPFRDMARDNRHSESALLTLRYGSGDVRGDPCGVARQVARTLAARGWPGLREACPRCSGRRWGP